LWPSVKDIGFEVDKEILGEEKLTVTVKDENKLIGGEKLLGMGKVL
jgi:hypothetical protein